MKIGVSACLLFSITNAWGFSVQSKDFGRVRTSLASKTAKNTELIAPPKLDEMDTTAMYNEHVQNTYGRYPLTMEKGEGVRLQTTDGKEYLDFVSGIATSALGHSNKHLNDAINDQMSKMHHVSNLYFLPQQAALATWLCDNSCADKAFFCNSGAEANESAIKLARRNAANRGIDKPVIITAHQSFHGRTLAALTATGQPKYHKGFGYGNNAMVPGFKYVTYNDAADLERIVKEINDEPGQGLAAIMLEALQGEGGIIPGDIAFFKKARELCDANDALLICDEVQVGMGRTGTLWGWQQLGGIEPDVFTSAKALGGGVPIGAMMAKGDAANVFGPGDHASTYGGNPLACRAGLAVAEYLTENNVLQNVQDRSDELRAGLEAVAKKFPSILGDVRGWGLLMGVVAKNEDYPAGNIVKEAMNNGLLLVPAGTNVVRFVPPLIVTSEDVQEALAKFEKAVETMANELVQP